MIVELGHLAAIFAFVLCFWSVSSTWHNRRATSPQISIIQSKLAVIQFLSLSFAFACMICAFLRSDFTVINVVENSHTLKPWLYKISGVWGNHEGSILFWAWILSIYGAAFAVLGKSLDPMVQRIVLASNALIGLCFLAFMLLTSNPFWRTLPPPMEGRDLNPLLQDPGLAFHPPLLYLGYVGSAILFGFAMAALFHPKSASAIVTAMRPWVLLVWSFLTWGIALGSYWAYYELGWGGWWFWDPVENASLMPWILATALTHSALVAKRGGLLHWTVLLSILTFSLSLLGTFMVRSGMLTSVHSFANDPERGLFLLMIFMILSGGGFILFALRAPRIASHFAYATISREMGIVIHSLFASVLCFTVFLGTLYPLFIELINGSKLSVGTPYFTLTFVPIAVPLIVVMGLAGFLKWGDAARGIAAKDWIGIILGTAFFTFAVNGILSFQSLLSLGGIALAGWAIAGSGLYYARAIKRGKVPISVHSMCLAHLGMGLSILGMVASIVWLSEDTVKLNIGQSADVGNYHFTLQQITDGARENYGFIQARLLVERENDYSVFLMPEKRLYPSQNIITTEVARDVHWYGDIYTALAEVSPDQKSATLRLSFHPFVIWIWLGAAIMGLAGIIQATHIFRQSQKIPQSPTPKIRGNRTMWILFIGATLGLYAAIGAPIFWFLRWL